MEIIVCIKRVPQTAEAEVKVEPSGKDIIKDRLTFDINEADSYALEQAILLKEKLGGTVTAISLGPAEAEDTLRIALAKGADNAIRIEQKEFEPLDGYKTALVLYNIIKGLKYDIILTGCIATDDGYSQVGPVLAELLGVPHATLVTALEVVDQMADIKRELEGGLIEHLRIKLPALFAVQTGINEPRYASLLAIRRAAKKEMKTMGRTDISDQELKCLSSLEKLYIPPVERRAEILTGSMDEISQKLARIIKEKGLI